MTVSVPVQVSKGLPVGEALLLGVVRGWPHKLKHRLPHVCKKSEVWVWTAPGLSPVLSLGWDYPASPPEEWPTLCDQGELAVRSGEVCELRPATPLLQPTLPLPKSWWKMWVTESSQRHWKKARPAGVMASWCFL